MFKSLFRGSQRVRSAVLGCCIALLAVACGGGGSDLAGGGSAAPLGPGNTGTGGTGGNGGTGMGTTMVTMTDAAGDFLSYIVTLTSLQLQTASGASVETLPVATQVDFTKLVNLTEVLSAGQVPAADVLAMGPPRAAAVPFAD